MKPDALIEQIARLLQQGFSHRATAALLGCSRGLVNEVAQGRRGPSGIVGPPIGRCPLCGRPVELPCRACAIQQVQTFHVPMFASQQAGEPEEPLALALRPKHRARYEQVRHRRHCLQERGMVSPINQNEAPK